MSDGNPEAVTLPEKSVRAKPGPTGIGNKRPGDMATRRKYGQKAKKKVRQNLRELKRGRLRSGRTGKKVRSRKQAIAIGLAQARRAGGKAPKRRK